ncbi:uncharacterized protein LOC120345576 isoform X1 [Styela clava]
MEIGKLQSFWKKKTSTSPSIQNELSSEKINNKSKLTANRNANNSNNKDTMDAPIQKHGSVDDLGEIRPEVTPEGYGLRTPYGTHLNLDFLQYCQNIADGETYQGTSPSNSRRLSSGSSKGSLNLSSQKISEKSNDDENEASNSKQQVEKNLWETRRRLDAFRSYRKKSSSALDSKQYIGRFNRLSPKTYINSGQRDLSNESDSTETPPVLTNLLNVPVPQQNLQAVREQMAAALSRLKYLESEVKQIPVLQVQISVLQQEKQKLNAELKKCKENSQVNGQGLIIQDMSTKENYAVVKNGNSVQTTSRPPSVESPASSPRSSGSLPPPPPRRKYKSTSAGPDVPFVENSAEEIMKLRHEELLKRLGRAPVNLNEYNPSDENMLTYNDVCLGISPETESKHTSTETTNVFSVNTSCNDLIATANASCGNHTITQNAESQYYRLYPLEERGTDAPMQKLFTDASSQVLEKQFCEKGVITENDFVIKYPAHQIDIGVGDDPAFEEKVPCIDVAITAQPDINTQGVNTTRVASIETAITCKPEVDEFSCLVNIHPDREDVAIATETTAKSDFGTITDDFKPEVTDRATDTGPQSQSEKSCLCRPDAVDFGCNVKIGPKVVVAATSTESKTLVDATINTNRVSHENALMQHRPFTSDACCFANILPPSSDVSMETFSSSTEIATQVSIPIPVPEISKSDAMTDTNDLDEIQPLRSVQSEIGSYVGQVESLLEEQQSLLADKYKELEGVLDEKSQNVSASFVSNSEDFVVDPIVAKNHEADEISPIKATDDLDVFTKVGYKLPNELQSACSDVDEHIKRPTEISSAFMENSLFKLQQEWMAISSLPTSRPDYIKDFAFEVKSISSEVLKKIVNATDSTGNSALHYAISHGNFGLVYTLADIAELDVDIYNNAGYTASMLAAITQIQTEFEVQAIAALFSRADVSLHAKRAGQTALMLAVSHGCLPAAKLLLKAGADINSQDEDGSTALMCATEHGHIDIVKLLLADPDCDPTITDHDGSAAINIAMESGQRDIAVLLYVQLKLD